VIDYLAHPGYRLFFRKRLESTRCLFRHNIFGCCTVAGAELTIQNGRVSQPTGKPILAGLANGLLASS
jgi:hypothetical protein